MIIILYKFYHIMLLYRKHWSANKFDYEYYYELFKAFDEIKDIIYTPDP